MTVITRRHATLGLVGLAASQSALPAWARVEPKKGQKLTDAEQELESFIRIQANNLYNDFYMRGNISDNGQVPRPGDYCASPDVWPNGATPLPNAATFLTNTYAMQSKAEVVLDQKNYIYVRARNLGADGNTAKSRLYYVPSQMAMWPTLWQKNVIKTDSGVDSLPLKAAYKNQVSANDSAFTWVPTKLPGNNHYCMCGQIITAAHPNPIPQVQYLDKLAAWLQGSPGIGWKNVNAVERDTPTWQTDFGYKNENALTPIYVIIDCFNVPNDCSVSLNCGDAGPNPQISIPKTMVDTSPSWTKGLLTTVPANFTSTITLSFWKGAQPMTSDAQINVRFMKVVAAGSYSDLYFSSIGKIEEQEIETTKGKKKMRWFQIGDVHFFPKQT